MRDTKENGRISGRILFCVLGPSVRPKREQLSLFSKRLRRNHNTYA